MISDDNLTDKPLSCDEASNSTSYHLVFDFGLRTILA